MDYHPSFEHYLAAKLRLMEEVVAPDGVAVINADGEQADKFIAAAQRRGLRLITVGAAGEPSGWRNWKAGAMPRR